MPERERALPLPGPNKYWETQEIHENQENPNKNQEIPSGHQEILDHPQFCYCS